MYTLVTGAAGFIGGHLCRSLLEDGARVVGIDNFDQPDPTGRKRLTVKQLSDYAGFRFCEADVRQLNGIAPGAVEAVVHLAARAGVRQSIQQPLQYAAINVGGTAGVLEWCWRRGVKRVVVASSSSIYGHMPLGPATEDRMPNPRSPYAASKLATEHLCRSWARQAGARVMALRFFSVYGPAQRPDQAMSRFAQALLNGEPLRIRGDGTSERDYTHVRDVVAAILAALQWADGSPGFEVVNVGSGCPVRLNWVCERMAGEFGVRQPAVMRESWHRAEALRTHADLTKARNTLGYHPRVSLADGLREFVNWSERTYGGQRIPAARAS